MVATEVSGSLVVQSKNLLVVFDEETEKWNIPTDQGKRGELSADTAERALEEHTTCETKDMRYKKKLKTVFSADGEEFRLQPYHIEIDGEPEDAEWIELSQLDEKELAHPLAAIKEDIQESF